MKTFRLITVMVLVIGLIGVFSALGAEQTKTGNKGTPVTEKKESKDQKKAPAAAVQSLPLTITRLYLKDGKVHVVIKKQGSKRLSNKDYAATKLKVEASTLKKPLEWTLLEVDPRKRLNQLMREKDFDTGLAVTERTRVTATLYRGLWKTAKEENLYPTMATVDVKTRMAAPQQKRDGDSPPEPVLLFDDRGGIRITSPDDDDVIDFSRGSIEPMNVVYRFTRSDIPAGNLTFILIKVLTGRTIRIAETIDSYTPSSDGPEELSFSWNVYEDIRDLPGCDAQYFIRAEHENGAYGTSDTFTIDCPGEGYAEGGADVQVVSPNGGEYFDNPCGTIGVRFRIVGSYGAVPDLWGIRLSQWSDGDGRAVRPAETILSMETTCEDYEDVDAGSVRYRECHVVMNLMATGDCPPCGSYKIYVYNAELGASMDDYSNISFGLGVCRTWAPISVDVQRSLYYGEDIKIGENIRYRWAPVPVEESITQLMRGDEPIYTNEDDVITGDRYEGSFSTDSLVEGDYKVRVTNGANSANWADSRTFRVRP